MNTLVWFRSDLRTEDNAALARACRGARGGVAAVFLACPDQWREHDWADAKVAFVRRNLVELSTALAALRIPLLVRKAATFRDAPGVLLDLARRHRFDQVHFNIEHEVNERRRDEAVADLLGRERIEVHGHHDQTIVRPDVPRTGEDRFYTVFSPFKRRWLAHLTESGVPDLHPRPRPRPEVLMPPDDVPTAFDGFDGERDRPDLWPAGEAAARARLLAFASERIDAYADARDEPAAEGTSRLSPYLASGVVSARQCLHAALDANGGRLAGGRPGPDTWISELIWREFYRHVLVGYPRICMHRPFRLDTDRIAWREDDAQLTAWTEGRTGFPIVDAAMRQLLETGWMHNRLRMITAMFLTKDLLLDWRLGERHFMRHLVDGDLASNNGGWQWSASTGTDAVPYFRIFNPFRQSRRFDPAGGFIRRHVPELSAVEGDAIHEPSALPPLPRARIDYPEPIVDHARAKERAVAAFKALRNEGPGGRQARSRA